MRLRPMVRLLPLLFVLVTAAPAGAQVATGSQLWLQGVAIVPLSENWRLHLEEQPRWDDDVTKTYQVITRAAIGRRLNSHVSVWTGYAWVAKPGVTQVRHEQRIWQQVSVAIPTAGRWAPSLRLRTEQRWQSGWADSSHRVRIMGRGVRPIAAGTWSAIVWGESFFALDETAGGPARGPDHHRLFAGTGRKLSRVATLEAGYLHVVAHPRSLPVHNTPGALVTLNMAF